MKPVGKTNHRKIQEITSIIAHEVLKQIFNSKLIFTTIFQLVHMFFGNLVTCEYWDYVWLNEGFASYLEYTIADKVIGI